MRFTPLKIAGAYVVESERLADERGYFARVFCEDAFGERGLATRFPQTSVSFNGSRGTVRGMHFQAAPHEEAKVVSCFRGAIWDVVLDLRADSPTEGQWAAVELRAGSPRSLYVAEGLAHGFQTLEDDTLVHYQISKRYTPAAARGVRWDDPAFAIGWPLRVSVISGRDASYASWAGRTDSETGREREK